MWFVQNLTFQMHDGTHLSVKDLTAILKAFAEEFCFYDRYKKIWKKLRVASANKHKVETGGKM